MPKKKKPVVIPKNFIKDNEIIVSANKFVYEVQYYRISPNSFNLEDSKYIKSDQYLKDKTEKFIKEGIMFRRIITLVGAPIAWLTENKFVELCPDLNPTLKK